MTLNELVEKYKKQILSSKDKKSETEKVIHEINNFFCFAFFIFWA